MTSIFWPDSCSHWRSFAANALADNARAVIEALVKANPFVPDDSVPQHIQDHLFRDIGPTAFANGGEALMTMSFMRSMSRGPLLDTEPGRRKAG